MKFLSWLCCCLFFITACQSDTDRLREAEHRFLEIMSVPEEFQLTAGKDTLFLPVLPGPESAQESKANAAELQVQIRKIDGKSLGDSDRKRLDALTKATEDLVARGVSMPLEQISMQVAEPFRQALIYNNTELTRRLVEYIPAYVAEMEQRWPPDTSKKNPEIVHAAESAYDALLQLEQESSATSKEQFEAARRAWKDYMGLCRSGLLSQNNK